MASPGRLVSRSPIAAGPISSAVDKMVPIVSADRATAMEIAIRIRRPTSRTLTPRTAARSAATELSSSGRYATATMPTAATLSSAMTGSRELLMVNMEPNRIVTAAPVTLLCVVSQ